VIIYIHQDPDFYYLTGYKEPISFCLLYSEMQSDNNGMEYEKVLYAQKRMKKRKAMERKTTRREGVKKHWFWNVPFNAKVF